MRCVIFALLVVLSGVLPAFSLDMNFYVNTSEQLAYVNLWGEIAEGDDAKFKGIVVPLIRSGNVLYEVNVFTWGGSVNAAIGIGRQIRALKAITVAPTLFDGPIDRGLVPGTTVQCWFWTGYNGQVMNNDPKYIYRRDAY